MLKIITILFEKGFGKVMILALLIAISINVFLCYERKLLQSDVINYKTEATLIRADNQNLSDQVERANLAIHQYQQQIASLHNKILTRLQHAESRSNEILEELEKHKTWRDQPIPTGIKRLFNKRNNSQANKTDTPNLSGKPAMSKPTIPFTQ